MRKMNGFHQLMMPINQLEEVLLLYIETEVIPTGLNGIEPLKNSKVKFIKLIMII